MVRGTEFRIVLVTCGSMVEARKMAKVVVRKRLAACVNVIGPIESIFWWKGKAEMARESLLILKTDTGRVKALEKEVRRLHSYEVPEFLVVGVQGGSKEYLRWLENSLR